MKTKYFLLGFFVLIAIAVVLLFTIGITSPDENATRASITGNSISDNFNGQKVMINKANSNFEFEGFGPGKSHLGTFDDLEGYLYMENNKIVGFEGVIKTNSVQTGIGGLDTHLKSPDFFNAEAYPEIKFMSKSINDGKLSGDLTFLGVTKELTFPVTVTEDSISSDFVFDTKEFGLENPKANTEVRIVFMLS